LPLGLGPWLRAHATAAAVARLPGIPPPPPYLTAPPPPHRYIIPGGSAAHFHRQGFTFDVGSSMMFGFGDKGTTNLMTRALASVGKRLETVPDPTQIHYHLPAGPRHPQARLRCPCGSQLPDGCARGSL
jgi:hypothetical protein